ncbi:hypothetical protein V144x_47400 [Gimesia aquarii]|uniref:Uncharacterized protein n=1 Tax=Gimesia aquarii TaxID=2527964 RepID=A0A517W1V1_9PLAN|nr:hypothetical protein V144x_47400 [Gimesia aquarii]
MKKLAIETYFDFSVLRLHEVDLIHLTLFLC